MRSLSQARPTGYVILALVVTTICAGQAHAEFLTFKVNLKTGVGDSALPPYISYQSPIRDANGDGWYETVLKITLNGSPYNQAMFQVQYTAPPTGDVNLNIGDSSTNDSGSGDAGTQSNDAEVSVGRGGGVPTTFWVWGRDGTPTPGEELEQVPNFATNGVLATFVVRNNFVSWDNGQGVTGSLNSPYLFALAGQPDSEGPVNYDIYAAFNKVIAGDYRFGSGVGQVTVTLSSVPEPSSLVLLGLGLAGIGLFIRQRQRRGRDGLPQVKPTENVAKSDRPDFVPFRHSFW